MVDASTPVRYDLLVDTTSDFSSPTPAISQNNLTSTTFAPSITSPLSDGAYFWKVRARDAAGNTGAFSPVSVFTVDTSSPLADCLDSNSISTSHTFVTKWGSLGTGNSQFNEPSDVAIDNETCHVYVTDSINNRIKKFTGDGTFITAWGSAGTGNGQFNSIQGIAVDPSSGDIYVADYGHHGIQKFTNNGTFITRWGSGPIAGSADGQFNRPVSVAVDSAGNVYVSDKDNNRIQKFRGDGTFITKWGSQGTGNGQFSGIMDLAIDLSNNEVYVLEGTGNRIQKFNSNGGFITKWGTAGTGDSQFNFACGFYCGGIAVEPTTGDVYVSDGVNDRIQKFMGNGTFLTKFGSTGTTDGSFDEPGGIAIDSRSSNRNLYVVDSANDRVQVFTGIIPASNVSAIIIISANNTSPIWGIDTVGISGITNGSSAGDYVIVDWGDNSTSNSTIGINGSWTASHLYNASGVGLRHVNATLFSAGGQIKASTSMQPDIVVGKHTTSISLRVPESVNSNNTFIASGDAFDTSYGTTNTVPLSGAQISFNGTGASEHYERKDTRRNFLCTCYSNWHNEYFKLYQLSFR